MKHGVKPIQRDTRNYSFHRNFGGVAPVVLPEQFSVDLGLTMPNQNADGLPEACTAYTQLELCSDQDGKVYDTYKDLYIKTLQLENELFGQPCSLIDSFKMAILYYNRGAYYQVESSKMDWFDSIRSVIYTNFQSNNIKCAVSIGTPWYPSWSQVNSTGIVPTIFTGDVSQLPWHNFAIKGWRTIDNQVYLLGKIWQGKNVGDGGWYYFPRSVINSVMKTKGTGAFTLAPRLSTNIKTVKITILESILNFLKQVLHLDEQLLKLQTGDAPQAPVVPQDESKGMKLYNLAMSKKGQNLTLDPTVPKGLNCAETISTLLKEAGYLIPDKGFQGTIGLNGWLSQHCTEIEMPNQTVGDVIVSVTQGDNHGHVGILGYHAILSNDSQTGTLESYWSLPAWFEFYKRQKGLVTKFYRLK